MESAFWRDLEVFQELSLKKMLKCLIQTVNLVLCLFQALSGAYIEKLQNFHVFAVFRYCSDDASYLVEKAVVGTRSS